ncbi:hypothetical protein [Bifidobacterium sp.]|uniref:hypothetical protein n=1 Tax=Bifidobacterium sp. TaxID=41200 RepID=UPI0039EAD197
MERQHTLKDLRLLTQYPDDQLTPKQREAVKLYREDQKALRARRAAPRKAKASSTSKPSKVEAPAMSLPTGAPDDYYSQVEFVNEVPRDAMVNVKPYIPPKYLWTAMRLREKPNQWARINSISPRKRRLAVSAATNIHNGRYKAFTPAGAFEAKAITTPSGEHHVYARYVGEST